jgi:hypothetical protein
MNEHALRMAVAAAVATVIAGCGGNDGDLLSGGMATTAAMHDGFVRLVMGVSAVAPDNTEPIVFEGMASSPDDGEPVLIH